MTLRGWFVTGTDTGVGKTLISAALLHGLAQQGLRCAGLKPVAAGVTPPERINEDVHLLHQASTIALEPHEVGPCQLREPCAPTIAAALEGRTIDRAQLKQTAMTLAARTDILIIEGVGGFCVPLGADWDSADLACDYGLPVILVVGLRLGGINHALLTAQAVAQRGLPLAGWIGNTIAAPMSAPMPHLKENLATLTHELHRRHGAPCLGVVPWVEAAMPEVIAKSLNLEALLPH